MLKETQVQIARCRALIEEMRSLSLPHLHDRDPIKTSRVRVVRELNALTDPDAQIDEIIELCRFAEQELVTARKLYGMEDGKIYDEAARDKLIVDITRWSDTVVGSCSRDLRHQISVATKIIFKIYDLELSLEDLIYREEKYRASPPKNKGTTVLCFSVGATNATKIERAQSKITRFEEKIAELYGSLTPIALVLFEYKPPVRRNALEFVPLLTM